LKKQQFHIYTATESEAFEKTTILDQKIIKEIPYLQGTHDWAGQSVPSIITMLVIRVNKVHRLRIQSFWLDVKYNTVAAERSLLVNRGAV
jgi:hypothetical protein